MRMTLRAASCLTLALSGCVSADPATNAADKQTASAVADAGVKAARKGLPTQSLLPGECGLFLWTRREQPEFVFFSKGASETALFWSDEKTLVLDRVRFGGEVFGQQLTQQGFRASDGRDIHLSMTPGDELISGQRIPEASLTITDDEGWKTLVPVAGVTACQPEG